MSDLIDPREVEESLDGASRGAIDLSGDYRLEVFMSTDGKHTVSGSATTESEKRKMLKAVEATYFYLISKYGTKQRQAIKEYSKEADVVSENMCPVHKQPWTMGKFGPYCTRKNEDGSWCKQKPKK